MKIIFLCRPSEYFGRCSNVMKEERCELLVIGGGPAGIAAAELATDHGLDTVLVEKQFMPGGAVYATGGVPTKTLRESALHYKGVGNQDVYGLHAGISPEVILNKISQRIGKVTVNLQMAIKKEIGDHGIHFMEGQATFFDRNAVLVSLAEGGECLVTPRKILVATGSEPVVSGNFPERDPDVYTSNTIYGIDRIPQSMVIVGGGPVGVEYASIFEALGTSVTLVCAGEHLLPAFDMELCKYAQQLFQKRGIRIVFGVIAEWITRINGELNVCLSNNEIICTQKVLLAAGRRVRADRLMPERAGVELTGSGGIQVNEFFQTSNPDVYAAGDVVAPSLASVAMEQGRVAACHAFSLDCMQSLKLLPAHGVYSIPEIAMVGLTEEQAVSQNLDYAAGYCYFDSVARSHISGNTEGMLKLLFHKVDRRLLGVHLVNDIASEIIGIGQTVMHFNGTIDAFTEMTFNLPTHANAYRQAAYNGLKKMSLPASTGIKTVH